MSPSDPVRDGPPPSYSEFCTSLPRQGWHQWWCAGVPCLCLPEWIAYDAARRAGGNPMFPPTSIVEGPPCAACQGRGEQTEPSGLRGPCALGEGQRHPKCRGNGGGRMSPVQLATWAAEHEEEERKTREDTRTESTIRAVKELMKGM